VGPLLHPPRTISHSTVAEVFQPWRRRLDLDLVIAIIRALGADDATVDRWRAAYLRVHRDTKDGGPAGVLRQLPVDLATFIGREKEIAFLTDAATEDSGSVVIAAVEGMAGVGKTQLALHAAHRLIQAGRYTDVQLYANLRGFDPEHEPADPAAVLDVFLRQLEVPAAHVPAGLDERAAMFRDRMHGRQALLLLDNAADDNQLRPLLPASPTCMVIITSRRSLAGLEGAHTVTLDTLDPTESIELLARIIGPDRIAAEPEAAAKIAAVCGGLPLAVSLVAARLRSRPVWTLQYLADRLGTSLNEITAGTRELTRVFDLSYQGLPPTAKHVFRLLGIHPATDFTAASITALARIEHTEAERILELLQDEKLIQQKILDRYELHDLLRAYATERATTEATDQERTQAITAVLTWYLATATTAAQLVNPQQPPPFPTDDPHGHTIHFPTSKTALAWYDHERSNLLRIFTTAATQQHHRIVVHLALAMTRFEETARNWRETERLLRAALPHAQHTDTPEAEVQLLYRLAFTLYSDNRSNQALTPLQQALTLTRKHHDIANEQQVLNYLALAHTGAGNHQQGLEVALQALSLREHAEVRPVSRSIIAFNTVAACLHELDRPEEALTHITTSITEARTQNDHMFLTAALHNLGFTYLTLHRYTEAITAFEESATIANNLGNRYIHADSLNGIARTLHAQGHIPQAQQLHKQALAIFDDLPHTEATRYLNQLNASPLRYPPHTAIQK
jgi:tetratricopeptide (TPR) repeat protein